MSKTSTHVKQRYLDKTYKIVSARLPIDMVDEFKSALQKDNIPLAEFLRRAIKQYLENRKGPAD